MRRSRWLFAGLVVVGLVPDLQAAPASPAHRHVVALASEIGPRKTGSESDGRAVAYVRRALEEAGLRVEVQEIDRVLQKDGEVAVGSWNVLGWLPGESVETLILAAHHDSRGASVPGANDDASGVAVLIETARRVAARPRRLSYLFASFGAEEEGLLGSRHFARGADLSRVRAMVALELVGRGELLVGPVPGPPPPWAQEALLRAARAAGVRGVVARPLWTIAPRLLDLPYTADHEPFRDRGVPAFLIAGTYAAWMYHTPEDTTGVVRPRALERAIEVTDRLLRDLEAAPPRVVPDAHYLPITLFGRGLVIPSRVLWGIGAGALGWAAALALLRIRRLLGPARVLETLRVLIAALGATVLGLSGLFVGELLQEKLHGVRYPWMAHAPVYLALAAAGGLCTGWLGFKLFRRIKPTVDPGPYGAAALLIPAAATGLALYHGWPELAFFAAVPLLAFLLARLTGRSRRKFGLAFLGLVPLGLLMTPADYRTLIDLGGVEVPAALLFTAAAVVALPFVLQVAHIAAFQDCLHSRAWWWLARGRLGAAALLLWLALMIAAAFLPAYDAGHRQVVRVTQTIDLDAGRALVRLDSSDMLDGVTLRGPAGDSGKRSWILEPPLPSDPPVISAEASRDGGDPLRVTCTVRLRSPRPTDRLEFEFRSRSGFRVPGRGEGLRSTYTYTRVSPVTDTEERFVLLVPQGGDLDLLVRAEYDADLLDLRPAGPAHVFVHRSAVTAAGLLRATGGPAAAGAAGGAQGGVAH